MIKYALICAADHPFEAWFRSSDDYDKQAEAGHVSCPVCGGSDVRKALMTPNLGTRQNKRQGPATTPAPQLPALTSPAGAVQTPTAHANLAPEAAEKLVQMMRTIRQHVLENGENMGREFADEARRIHSEDAPDRLIYGETTPEEARELEEEGVPVAPLPVLPEDHN